MYTYVISKLTVQHICMHFQKKKIKLSPDLSDCVVYVQSRHFKGFEDARCNATFKHISSLDEDKTMSLIESQVRVLPRSLHLNSHLNCAKRLVFRVWHVLRNIAKNLLPKGQLCVSCCLDFLGGHFLNDVLSCSFVCFGNPFSASAVSLKNTKTNLNRCFSFVVTGFSVKSEGGTTG